MPVNRCIMAWDPGGTTGICVGHQIERAPWFVVEYNSVVQWAGRFARIRDLIEHHQPRVTIIESFTLYKHKAKDQIGSQFPSSQVIGIIEAFLWMTGLPDPVFQPAALISGRPAVQILPEHAPLVGATEHAKDAYKHLRYWVEQQRHRTPVQTSRVV